jgi:hypothetical protein
MYQLYIHIGWIFHYIVHEKIRHCQNGRAVFPKNGIFGATEGPSKDFYINKTTIER